MSEEEKIKQELEGKFEFLKDAVLIRRRGRIFLELSLEKFAPVFDYALKQLSFSALSAITGMDRGDGLSVIYHINREGRIVLSLKVNLEKENPAVNTVTESFTGADIYERELMDLLGIKVLGLAAGDRYPLADNWPKDQHPLRKDWKGSNYKKEPDNA